MNLSDGHWRFAKLSAFDTSLVYINDSAVDQFPRPDGFFIAIFE